MGKVRFGVIVYTMTEEETNNTPRQPTPAENRVVILALAGFFAIVLAVALVPSFLKQGEEEPTHRRSLPPPVRCAKGADQDNLSHCQKAKQFELACRKGDAKACWNVGGFYLENNNAEYNRKIGIKWIDHACNLGSLEACAWFDELLVEQESIQDGAQVQ